MDYGVQRPIILSLQTEEKTLRYFTMLYTSMCLPNASVLIRLPIYMYIFMRMCSYALSI